MRPKRLSGDPIILVGSVRGKIVKRLLYVWPHIRGCILLIVSPVAAVPAKVPITSISMYLQTCLVPDGSSVTSLSTCGLHMGWLQNGCKKTANKSA